MFAGIGAWFGGAWNWFMGSPVAQFFAAILGLIFAWEVTKKTLKAEGAREQARIHNEAAARAAAEVAATETQIAQERTDDAAHADAAVEALPRFNGDGQLRPDEQLRITRPDLHSVLFGNAPVGS